MPLLFSGIRPRSRGNSKLVPTLSYRVAEKLGGPGGAQYIMWRTAPSHERIHCWPKLNILMFLRCYSKCTPPNICTYMIRPVRFRFGYNAVCLSSLELSRIRNVWPTLCLTRVKVVVRETLMMPSIRILRGVWRRWGRKSKVRPWSWPKGYWRKEAIKITPSLWTRSVHPSEQQCGSLEYRWCHNIQETVTTGCLWFRCQQIYHDT